MPAARPITGITIAGGVPYSANAWGDGSNDDTAVLQAALTACGLINIPSGTYRTTSTLTIPANAGSGMLGTTPGFFESPYTAATNAGVTILGDFTTGHIIANSCANPQIKNMELRRAAGRTASSGSCGLDTGASFVNGTVEDLSSWYNNIGFYLRCSGTGTAEGIVAETSGDIGVLLEGTWNVGQSLSELSGGHGWQLQGTADSGNLDGMSDYGSGGNGLYIIGMPNLRLTNGFFGGDAGYGAIVGNTNPAGKNNQITHCYCELTINQAWFLGANTRENFLTNVVGEGGAGGVLNASAAMTIQNGWFKGTDANAYAILTTAGSNSVIGALTLGSAFGIGATVATGNILTVGNYVSPCTTPLDINCAWTQLGDY